MAGSSKGIDVTKLKKKIRSKQATINRNSRKLKSAPKTVIVGWDKSSGKYNVGSKPTVMYIAKIHDEGLGYHTKKNMIAETTFLHQHEWTKLYKKLVKQALKKGKLPNLYILNERVGRAMRDDLRAYLYDIKLVDTSRMANSIIVRYKRR